MLECFSLGAGEQQRSALRMIMKVTYDGEANASYIYFTSIGVGGVKETVTDQKLDVDLDKQKQIIAFTLFESDECAFRERLTYVLTHPEARYDQLRGSLQISFVESRPVERRIVWDANVDLEKKVVVVNFWDILEHPEDREKYPTSMVKLLERTRDLQKEARRKDS